MADTWLKLTPNDILFFRGTEPFNAGETGYIRSQFPPSPSVIQGAVRTGLLEANGVDLRDYTSNYSGILSSKSALMELVGPPKHGFEVAGAMQLDLLGPFVVLDREVLLPVPFDLVKRKVQDGDNLLYLSPMDNPLKCDLGNLRTPSAKEATAVETLKGSWLRTKDDILRSYLTGKPLSISEATVKLLESEIAEQHSNGFSSTINSRVHSEHKVGLALQERTKIAQEGMLYYISPLRFGEDVHLVVGLRNDLQNLRLPDILHLGGEGRFVVVEKTSPINLPFPNEVVDKINSSTPHRFKLVLLQPTIFLQDDSEKESSWLPNGFSKSTHDGYDCWEGELGGLRCRLISACVPGYHKIGGWDIARNAPSGTYRAVPAGSVYFFETEASGEDVVRALHDQKIGSFSKLGFGHCIIGGW